MKTYIVKPDHLSKWQAYPMTVVTDEDIKRFSVDWEIPEEELLEQVIELPESGWRPIHRFVGKVGWPEINELISDDSGCQEDYCETEEDFRQAVRDGFIKYDGYYTTVYVDD